MKEHRLKIAAGLLIVAMTGVVGYLLWQVESMEGTQRGIASQIIRLHVIANSDDEKDQELKLKVKERVVVFLRGVMSEADSVERARSIIQKHLGDVEQIAEETMRSEGYDYDAKASLDETYFPIKEYGEFTFPAGEYEALRVQIGKSEGHNWWCVMYPTLCFVDATYQIVPEQSKEKLKTSLTEQEYQTLLDGGGDLSYSFKFIEWIQKFT